MSDKEPELLDLSALLEAPAAAAEPVLTTSQESSAEPSPEMGQAGPAFTLTPLDPDSLVLDQTIEPSSTSAPESNSTSGRTSTSTLAPLPSISSGASSRSASSASSTSHLHVLPPEAEPFPTPDNIVEEIATYAKNATIGNPPLTPRIPFTLRISGMLGPHHRTRLLDLIKAADLGLREMDLEPQFESGQLLISRISEYVGIQIVQALRDAPVRMTLTSDSDDPDLLPPAA